MQAAANLHAEVGPAATTVAEIARRAGVRRATVYNHFPDEGDLFGACGDYSLMHQPPPDPAAALELDDPAECLRAVLTAFYGWYRQAERRLRNLHRDRMVLPSLDEAMTQRMDQPLARLVTALAARIATEDTSTQSVRAVVALALDFWTWRRLAGEGLSDAEAAAVMVCATIATAGQGAKP